MVVPIILRELVKNDISPGIKQMLNERVWIKWEGKGKDKEKYFWKRVNLALGRRSKAKKKRVGEAQEPRRPRLVY